MAAEQENKSYYLPGDLSRTPLNREEFCEIMRPIWKQRKRLQRSGECNAPTWHQMKEQLIIQIKGKEIDAVNAASLSGKLCQMANGAVYTEEKEIVQIHDRKLDALEDLIEGANGKPLLVAYWFKHDLKRIGERFPAVREIRTSRDITDWNAGRTQLAVIHPASAGHGLNLQAGGSTLVWFGLTWSLELYQQTNARLWRQGQTASTVVIHHIMTKGTIDVQIMQALDQKDKTQTELINAVKAQLGVKG